MSRDLDATSITESKSDNVRVIYLVWLDLDAGDAFYNSSNQQFDFDMKTADPAAAEPAGTNSYIGVGGISSIEAISETESNQAAGVVMTLTGIPTDNISMALNETYQSRKVTIRLAILDEGYNIINVPVLIFAGLIDNMEVEMGEDAAIKIMAESKFADWERPRLRRWNSQEQHNYIDNTDMGFEHVAELIDKEIVWGP